MYIFKYYSITYDNFIHIYLTIYQIDYKSTLLNEIKILE